MIASGREHDRLLMMYVKFALWRYYHHAIQVLSDDVAVGDGRTRMKKAGPMAGLERGRAVVG